MPDLRVTSLDPKTGDLLFKFPRSGSLDPISGAEKLAQQFSILLLTDAGTDRYAPDAGGGINSMLLSTTSAGDMEGVASAAIVATEDQIRSAQSISGISMSASERLASAALLSVEPIFDADGLVSGASVDIAMSTYANRAISHPVNLKV